MLINNRIQNSKKFLHVLSCFFFYSLMTFFINVKRRHDCYGFGTACFIEKQFRADLKEVIITVASLSLKPDKCSYQGETFFPIAVREHETHGQATDLYRKYDPSASCCLFSPLSALHMTFIIPFMNSLCINKKKKSLILRMPFLPKSLSVT